MRVFQYLILGLMLSSCSAVYPSNDFFAGLVCGGDINRYVGPGPCTPHVITCANGCESGRPCCTDAGCDDACIAHCQTVCIADDPECFSCIFQNRVQCINENGCQDAWDNYDCCVADHCGISLIDAPENDACVEEFCATEAVQYRICSDTPGVQTLCNGTVLPCAQVP